MSVIVLRRLPRESVFEISVIHFELSQLTEKYQRGREGREAVAKMVVNWGKNLEIGASVHQNYHLPILFIKHLNWGFYQRINLTSTDALTINICIWPQLNKNGQSVKNVRGDRRQGAVRQK